MQLGSPGACISASAMQLALYTSRSGWLEPAEASENQFNLV